MPYTPDATNYSEPTDIEKASTMGLEFRTLKAYIQSTIVAGLASKIGTTGINTFSAGSQLRFPGNNPLEGIIGCDYTTFTYDTNKVIPNYGLTWKTLSTLPGGPVAFLCGYGGIYFVTGAQVNGSLDGVGNLITNGSIRGAIVYAINTIRAGISTANGAVQLVAGDGAHTGYIEFDNPDQSRKGFIGYGGVGIGAPIHFSTDDNSQWQFSQDVIAPNFRGALVGNASTASSASVVPWTGVSGRPTALSQFTNDIGAGGSSGVSSFNGRTGPVTPSSSDVTGALGFTPYNASNPASYTTLAAVGAAGYITGAGNAATATAAGDGITSVSNVDSFTGSDSGAGSYITDVALTKSGKTLILTRYRTYHTGGGGGGP